MFSKEYLTQLEDRSKCMKTAVIGFLNKPGLSGVIGRLYNKVSPFQKSKQFAEFSKHFHKQNPWMKHMDTSMNDVTKYMHSEQPIFSTLSRAVNLNPEKMVKRLGPKYKDYIRKLNPADYDKAQQTLVLLD